MIQYGAGPGADEAEVVVFGPGYGESVAVHLGAQRWMIVDSCIDPFAKRPAALAYLTAIGVDPSCVVAVVASHWHDDHVRGIAEVAKTCATAPCILSTAFNSNEAMAFLAAYSGEANGNLSRGTRELVAVIESRESVQFSHQQCIVLEDHFGGRRIRVTAFSPVHAAIGVMVAAFGAKAAALEGTGIDNAVSTSANEESVALHIDFGDDAVLLGSDLENHPTLGWAAVVSDKWCLSQRRGSLYKVAHHGSKSGHEQGVWQSLLAPKSDAVLTPFTLGRHKIPDAQEIATVKGNAGRAFISSSAASKPRMETSQVKRLGDIVSGLKPVNNGFGAIRSRKAFGATAWTIECFGDARAL